MTYEEMKVKDCDSCGRDVEHCEVCHFLGKDCPEWVAKKNNVTTDNVNHPSHYNDGGIECIEAMRILYGDEAVKDFCILNAHKYLWRAGKKGDAEEDIEKAKWYVNYYDTLPARREMSVDLSEVFDDVCGQKCKWMELALETHQDDNEAMDYLIDTYCCDCPLSRYRTEALGD